MEELRSLVQQAQFGDLDAYNTIVLRFQDMAIGYAYSLLGDAQLAEDAAQEAFINAYLELKKLKEPAAFPGWFRKIVFTQCNRLTRSQRVETVEFEKALPVPAEQKGPDEHLEEKDMKDRTRVAIGRLPEQERTVITLFYINELSQAEVSAFLELPATTINGRLHTARKRLKKELLKMAKDNLKSLRASQNKAFSNRVAKFVEAVDAVVSGDTKTLKELLKRDPALVHMRSSREHGAMLIHYVAANGVENERQRTPANAVDVANTLISAGTEIDATFLDGKSGTTPLASLVTSVHPHKAGIASDLVEAFVKAGAKVNGLKGDGEPLRLALEFGYPESAAALVCCGAEIKTVVLASGLGRRDLVENFIKEKAVSEEDLVAAFGTACRYGWVDIAEYLLAQGVDVNGHWYWGFTGLMWAVRYGHIEVIKMILRHSPSLEIRNEFGGTALGAAFHFNANAPEPGANYTTVIDLLLRAGSKFDPSMNKNSTKSLNEVLCKHGVTLP